MATMICESNENGERCMFCGIAIQKGEEYSVTSDGFAHAKCESPTRERTEREYRTRNGATIVDRRRDQATPFAYLVCTDKFLSGWGHAPGRSYYALACESPDELAIVEQNARGRSEMIRPRVVGRFRADGVPAISLAEGDHLAVVDRHEAGPWYRAGTWT